MGRILWPDKSVVRIAQLLSATIRATSPPSGLNLKRHAALRRAIATLIRRQCRYGNTAKRVNIGWHKDRLAQGKEDLVKATFAELIHLQRQIADESQALTKTERRVRERHEVLKTVDQAESRSKGLRAVDTGDTSRPQYKVERW